ncbi:hypothetical protein G6031_08685 [Dietzia sp. CQ4]|uniref:AlbA family DNA-binding domain-containing protein n=1 Tax=Dietzia sp. (strain CQ4) TaxID=370437 RepID=UPI0015FA5002|nr:RNA-binding domain-containing protein [Dietzia sp. CQ4]MBB1034464.1 hypothetical protein [Dietzia sp. CQ4]
MISQQEVEDSLRLGYESRSFEVKGPGTITDKQYVARVVRAAMAMGNLRDGGQVCLGIDDDQMTAMTPGLPLGQANEWTDYDNVNDQFAKYSDPPVTFHLHCFRLSSGATVVIIDVEEFDIDLHICKKDYPVVLQAGQTYVRPRGKPQSSPVPSLVDMRDLHNLAIDKGVREYFRRSEHASAPFTFTAPPTPEMLDTAAFDLEAVEAWAVPSSVDNPIEGALGAGIVRPAYTDVSVRPGPYDPDRIRSDELQSFVAMQAVRLRGWPVPMVSSRDRVAHHGNWVGQDLQADVTPHVESWRVFSSGHFLQRRVIVTDLRDATELRPEDPAATGAVAVWDILLYLVEVAELGARYASALGVETVSIDVSLKNIDGRELISGERRRQLHGPYVTHAATLTANVVLKSPALLATPRAVGVDLTQQILRKFGLNVADKTLMDLQDNILDKTNLNH